MDSRASVWRLIWTGIALILGVDRILDMCRTVTNVTGDMTVASVVAASEGQLAVQREAA